MPRMSTVKLDLALFNEAMRVAGEPLPPPKKLSYRLLFGPDWRYSLLGYAYLRCVDNIVDSEEDTATSLELMAAQREFMATAYEADVKPEDLESFEHSGPGGDLGGERAVDGDGAGVGPYRRQGVPAEAVHVRLDTPFESGIPLLYRRSSALMSACIHIVCESL